MKVSHASSLAIGSVKRQIQRLVLHLFEQKACLKSHSHEVTGYVFPLYQEIFASNLQLIHNFNAIIIVDKYSNIIMKSEM
jgi:cytochrome c551/c552